MLERLITITNSADFFKNGCLFIKEVVIRPREDNNIKITLELRMEDLVNDKEDQQLWEINCKDIIYNTSNKIHEPKRPWDRINVYQQHPVLWNYEKSNYVSIKGNCKNIPELLGDLFIAHDKACGNWIDFHWLNHFLANSQEDIDTTLEIPEHLIDTYFKVFEKHKLMYSIIEVHEKDNDLSVLIFGNPFISPDDYSFGQPYIVAKGFEAKELNGS